MMEANINRGSPTLAALTLVFAASQDLRLIFLTVCKILVVTITLTAKTACPLGSMWISWQKVCSLVCGLSRSLCSWFACVGTRYPWRLVGCRISICFFVRVYLLYYFLQADSLRVDDQTPNIGLCWYLFMEMFEHFRYGVAMAHSGTRVVAFLTRRRTFFQIFFQVLGVAFVIPLAVRFRFDRMRVHDLTLSQRRSLCVVWRAALNSDAVQDLSLNCRFSWSNNFIALISTPLRLYQLLALVTTDLLRRHAILYSLHRSAVHILRHWVTP